MVKLFYSGGQFNKFPSASLGGGKSDTEIPDAQLGNLFDLVTRVEVINGRTEYRMFYIENDEASDYLRAHLKGLVIPVNAEISFAVDSAVNPQTIAAEDQTPIGLTFFKFNEWNELEIGIGSLPDTKLIAIWIRRKVLESSGQNEMVDFTIDAIDDTLTITQDFSSVENSFDNDAIRPRTPKFYTDLDFCGEALLS